MTAILTLRARYEREKAILIEELHDMASRHMAEFERLMREIDKLEAERFEDAYADDRSKEWREDRAEQRKLERDHG